MANNNESTMKWKVDINQLTKAMQDAKRSISVANAEFKTATASMDKWSKSSDGLEAKITQLNKLLPSQRSILASLEKQYALTAQNMGENSKEAQDLRIKIEEQRATIVKTETSINKYSDQLNQMQQKQAESERATNKLNATIGEQQDKLDGLKDAYKDAVLQYGKNSDEAQALAKQIEDLSAELADNRKTLKEADAAADTFDKSLQDVADDADDASEGFTVMKGVLANLVAQGINFAVEGLKNLANAAYDAWNAFDDGADTIITATGATGDAAEELMDVYDKVSSNVLDDFGNIGNAIGEVNTRFGITGSELEKVSTKFLKFSKLNGTNVKSSIDTIQSAMAAFGISTDKAGDVLDLFNKAGQDTGVSLDSLASLVKTNASALQEMGFSLSDSVMFLANLDKSGVDTASTLAGLKKALANAAKEGKPMSEALDDVEKSIKNAKTETDAITAATELFGSKAGASIAKAVRSGRLSFEDFGTTLDDFRGNIETTYDSIMDVPDDIALSIQNLRKTAAKAVDSFFQKYGKRITSSVNDFANKMMPKIERAVGKTFEFIDKHGEDVVSVLQAIATAFVTYKAVATITSVMKAFKDLSAAIKGGQTIMQAFNLTMAANPIALVAAAIAALTVLVIKYAKAQKEAIESEYGLSAAQQESINKAKELADSYADLDQARSEQFAQINSEFGYIDQLKNEYNGLIDANGKVKDGYEDRAAFILNQLSKALGIEVSEIQKVIDQNGKLGDSIDKIIQKKQAEATLAAGEDEYRTAIEKRTEALNVLTDAQKTFDDAEKTYQKTQQESQDMWTEYHRLLTEEGVEAAGAYYGANRYIVEANNEAKKSYDEAKQGVDDATNAWIGYNSTITNYEGLAAAIISGDTDKINAAMVNMQNGFITAENGNRESLERQVKNYETNLKNLELAIENGTPNVTQEMVDQAKSMVDAANKELDKLPPEASKTGEEAGADFAEGVGSAAKDAKSKAEELAEEAVKGAKSENGDKGGAKKSGENFGEGYANGMKSESILTKVGNAAAGLAKRALAWLRREQDEGSPSKITRQSGLFFGEGYQLGIEAMVDPVADAAAEMARSAVDALNSDFTGQMRTLGIDGGNNLVAGMTSSLADLKASVSTANAHMAVANGTNVGSFAAGGQQIQNVTFNQYNNSPKALDRLSIYRETNSLLFSAKVRLGNV